MLSPALELYSLPDSAIPGESSEQHYIALSPLSRSWLPLMALRSILIHEGSDDHDLPVSLIPHSFTDDNLSTHPMSPLTIGEEDITSIAHTPVDDPLPSTGDVSGDDIPLTAKNLQCSSRHTASTADLHADLAGDNMSVQNTSPDKGSVKVKPTSKKNKNEPKKMLLVPTMAAMTLSFLPSLPKHAKTYINDLQFRVPLETHHPEDDVCFHNEAQA